VLRHAASLQVRRARLACACTWRRRSLCCYPPFGTGDPWTEFACGEVLTVFILMLDVPLT
jgi:hypothetical protein